MAYHHILADCRYYSRGSGLLPAVTRSGYEMKIAWMLVVLLAIVLVVLFMLFGFRPSPGSDSLDKINLPQGFKIDVYASDLGGSAVSSPGPNPEPRMMLLRDGVLFVTITN